MNNDDIAAAHFCQDSGVEQDETYVKHGFLVHTSCGRNLACDFGSHPHAAARFVGEFKACRAHNLEAGDE